MKSSTRVLDGLTIIVTRPKGTAAALSEPLKSLGASVLEVPVIRFDWPGQFDEMDKAIEAISTEKYDWVIFTSVTGVRFFFERAGTLNIQVQNNTAVKIAAIGPATASALEDRGFEVNFVPEIYVAEEIISGLGDLKAKRILLPRADIARKALPELLRDGGALVDEVATYRTLHVDHEVAFLDQLREEILSESIDWLTFTSSSTVRHFVELLQSANVDADKIKELKVACIGPITERTARDLDLNVKLVAAQHDIPGLIDALSQGVGSDV